MCVALNTRCKHFSRLSSGWTVEVSGKKLLDRNSLVTATGVKARRYRKSLRFRLALAISKSQQSRVYVLPILFVKQIGPKRLWRSSAS
jgi:hypothetical protein